jgi:SAM-dependent methyltransferase
VDAIDENVAVIQQASTLSRDITRIRFVEADFMAWTAVEPYDFISMIAALHHLPFDDALSKAAALLRPGGVLAVIGLHRAQTLVHMGVRSLVGYPVSAFYRITRPTSRVGAPIREPSMTLSEIRCRAEALLPGVSIRRHVLWRYSMTWVKPLVTPAVGAIELRGEQAPCSSSCAPASSKSARLA